MEFRCLRTCSRIALLAICAAGPAFPATLPTHEGLRILIVSDEVNPHGLAPGDLTQPGELAAALTAPGSGLVLDDAPDAVLEIGTDEIELATARLAMPFQAPDAYDVLVYFAHRIPIGPEAAARQAAFTTAVEQFLTDGGGVVSFHHGAYLTAGKEAVLDLVGASATGVVTWNPLAGQNVINVAPTHFVTCNHVDYTGAIGYADPARGIAGDLYPYFNNAPDERYPSFEINGTTGDVEVLFASDYAENGTTHLLGFTHGRPDWRGRVVTYQPGEHEPIALDPAGANFQILANAILFSTGGVAEDGVHLEVLRSARSGTVELEWTGCGSAFTVYRSESPDAVVVPENLLGATGASSWIDAPPSGDVHFYRVEN